MKKIKVFVDGQEGTTGLKINERLAGRPDLEIMLIDPELRKDAAERGRYINKADLVFLCLPDDASREAVSLCNNASTRFIDASTAFRTHPDWCYGLPELSLEHKQKLASSKRVANPGCYATGFVALLYPLVQAGIIPKDYPISAFGISGYSGAGKKAIAQYEAAARPENEADYHILRTPRPYALGLNHKHLPEMQVQTGLEYTPNFTPIIGNYAQGMLVHIHLEPRLLGLSQKGSRQPNKAEAISTCLSTHYEGARFITVYPYQETNPGDGGFLNAQSLNDTNRMELFVHGNNEHLMLTARLDNLGKGASGAAVQSMNIMTGRPEDEGLV